MKRIALLFPLLGLLLFSCEKPEQKHLSNDLHANGRSIYTSPNWVLEIAERHNDLLDSLTLEDGFPFENDQDRQEAALLSVVFSNDSSLSYNDLLPSFQDVWDMEFNQSISNLSLEMLNSTMAGNSGSSNVEEMVDEFSFIFENCFNYAESSQNLPSVDLFSSWCDVAINNIFNMEQPDFNEIEQRSENISASLIATIELARKSYEYWYDQNQNPDSPWAMVYGKNSRAPIFRAIWRALRDAYSYFVNPCWSTGFDNPNCPGVCMDLECAGLSAGAASSK